MLPSADGSPLPGGPDDRTRFVPRTDHLDGRTTVVPAAGRVDGRTRIVPPAGLLDDRTTIVPIVRRPSRLRTLLPWAGFGLVAIVVVGATTAWASTLRGAEDPILANATPPPVVVSQMPVPAGSSLTATPAEETPVPAAATRKASRPTSAPAVPPKPAPTPVTTTTVKQTAAAATTTKVAAAATTTKPNGFIDLTPAQGCTPSATTSCPAANQAGSTARNPTPPQ